MRRRFAVAAAALALSAALTVPAYAGTWKYVNDQWKYQKGTNKFAYNEWIKDNGKYYYIGNDGIMKIGWQQIDGQWYYLDQTGAMQIGWLKSDDGKWYFLYPNGAMAVNTVIDGRTIGEDGVWVPNEGDTEQLIVWIWKMVIWYRTWKALQRKITRSLLPVRQPLDPLGKCDPLKRQGKLCTVQYKW